MIYIKYIGKRLGKNGNYCESWGWFFCEYCEQYVEKPYKVGKESISCGCQQYIKSEEHKKKISKSRKGKKHTEETKQKIKENHAHLSGENHPMYGKRGELNPKFGSKILEGSKQKIKENHADVLGENNPMYGKKHTEITRKKQSNIKKGKYAKENNPNWNNGSSFEPYSPEFNKELKNFILERDNYTCQCPDCEHKTTKLDIHHIDYDKKNNTLENLITLCDSCHTKTNGKNNRDYFTENYQSIMMNRLMECLL